MKTNKPDQTGRRSKLSKPLRHLKPALIIVSIPLFIGILTFSFMLSGSFEQALGQLGAKRLETANWEKAQKIFLDNQPNYERKFAYYQLRENQDLTKVATYFSVPESKLTELNPGTLVSGTTIKLPPPEHPLTETQGPNSQIFGARVEVDGELIRIKQDYKFDMAITTIPELMSLLKPYGAIEKTGERSYRLNRAISLEDNIRLDLTDSTVNRLELRSQPNDVVCLCTDGAAALIKGVEITSVDPETGKPDKDHEDRRSFIRNKAGRMDIIDSKISYLGNGLIEYEDPVNKPTLQKEGGTYGISWRISDDRLGQDVVTGWVEGTDFVRNHFGAYTFGASGMTWRNNYFYKNDVYGLDPHDDSNNALVEYNVFAENGKHGFIVSKRCNYNIIRYNTSYGNKLHGFMLHQDSAYNVIEHNISADNVDNYVIYASDFNTVRKNIGYNAKSNHVRINEGARNSYVVDNQFVGGRRGIYLYGGLENVYVANNNIQDVRESLATAGAQGVFVGGNNLPGLSFGLAPNDWIIFGQNTVSSGTPAVPREWPLPEHFTPRR